MKLRKVKAKYKLPADSRVLRVWVEGNQRHNKMHAYLVPIVPAITLWREQKSAGKMPKACAVYNGTIEFSPPPDKPYVVKVMYVPPVMEC
jgi:hypothetical protein